MLEVWHPQEQTVQTVLIRNLDQLLPQVEVVLEMQELEKTEVLAQVVAAIQTVVPVGQEIHLFVHHLKVAMEEAIVLVLQTMVAVAAVVRVLLVQMEHQRLAVMVVQGHQTLFLAPH